MNLLGQTDRLCPEPAVEAVLKEFVELDPQEPALGEKGAVLFDDGKEMGNAAGVGDDHRFPEQGAAFGAADVEHVGEGREVLEGDVVFRGAQGIGQAGAVDVERNAMSLADIMNGGELRLGVYKVPNSVGWDRYTMPGMTMWALLASRSKASRQASIASAVSLPAVPGRARTLWPPISMAPASWTLTRPLSAEITPW